MESSRDDFVIAIRSAFLKRETKQRFSLLGLIIFSVIFLSLGALDYKIINYTKSGIKEIVYRASFIVSIPENFLKQSYLDTKSHFDLYQKNEENIIEIENLRSKNLSQKIIELENIKYKKLLDDYFIKDNEIYAKVLIDKDSPFLKSVVLNKGSKNSVKLGMIVLDETYLVGKVVEVNYLTSRVLLLSDINSKIPVAIQPGDVQAIMSGDGEKAGVLQYIKVMNKNKSNKDLIVLTSGAGGLFKSGIPIGNIFKNGDYSDNDYPADVMLVDFYKDFSQLKYVKVISFSKQQQTLDQTSRDGVKKIEDQIIELNAQKDNLRILLEQKKIADEIRIKIQEENIILKDKAIKLQNRILEYKKDIEQFKVQAEKIKYRDMEKVYKNKCKKRFNNKLYKIGTPEYKACILRKGLPKKD